MLVFLFFCGFGPTRYPEGTVGFSGFSMLKTRIFFATFASGELKPSRFQQFYVENSAFLCRV